MTDDLKGAIDGRRLGDIETWLQGAPHIEPTIKISDARWLCSLVRSLLPVAGTQDADGRPTGPWKCFKCGMVITKYEKAEEHFASKPLPEDAEKVVKEAMGIASMLRNAKTARREMIDIEGPINKALSLLAPALARVKELELQNKVMSHRYRQNEDALKARLRKVEAVLSNLDLSLQAGRTEYSRNRGQPEPTPAFPVQVVFTMGQWDKVLKALAALRKEGL